MSVQSRTEAAAKDRMFKQSLSILYLLVDLFLIMWVLRATTAFERIAAGFSILGVSVLLLKTVDRLKADATLPTALTAAEKSRSTKRTMVVTIGFVSWLGLYWAGCTIGAYRYIQAIQQPGIGVLDLVWNGLVIAASYTYSNVGILCIICAVIGSYGRMLSQSEGVGRLRKEVVEDLVAKAILRSAVIAGVVITAAILLGSPTTFRNPDPYISFALMMSAVGLVNGYMPQWFYHEE